MPFGGRPDANEATEGTSVPRPSRGPYLVRKIQSESKHAAAAQHRADLAVCREHGPTIASAFKQRNPGMLGRQQGRRASSSGPRGSRGGDEADQLVSAL